ncbi:bifunctional serine/threonine-protein kinase/ABC transporter substrate-binding protein [Argonema antarcticum]|uniref:bifunctional serine/threonine-protein kinase/ABC transporter substrate-binding protein n=1 Tax=Argonema antarcticum TaxID=2942763 RepID=UPI0020112CD8|nr:bifunctional serine/threonine-protein kinase/ABC transporter substrate-binding protein [Argonema antarcticum]MCL1469793.1 ABC transporter substrate-binding protein [Argonema antarcticum A004/B2]
MSYYCINPWCQNRENPEHLERCQSCETELLVKNRYRLVRPLRDLDKHPYTNIFEVEDIEERQTLKVLKVLIKDITHIVELFEQEANLLINLTHQGIPRAESELIVSLSKGRELRCLVMEKIEGLNLEQWLKQNGRISENLALNWLKQLVVILDYVHRNNLFHRDIKPSNIMLKDDGKLVLIDFGTARRVTQTVIDGQNVTKICSHGYTAPEQMAGRAVPQSDFFALGCTFVHLLTGIHPNKLTRERQTDKLIWRYSATPVSRELANLIDDMMAVPCQKRPKNTQEILHRIKEIESKTFCGYLLKRLSFGAVFLVFATVIYGSNWYLTGVRGCAKIEFRNFHKGDNLSCGEEILVSEPAVLGKQEGVIAFADGKYQKAAESLEKAWNKRREPETLIYLNNARLMNQKAYTIAVVAPITNNRDRAMEILRGVAQAQNEFNDEQKKINGMGLKVLIGDDANDPIRARKMAESLVSKGDILGVVGHYASEVTMGAIDVYQKHGLVLVSPGSTSEDLSVWSNISKYVFFRTVPSNRVNAQAMASYLIQAHQRTAAVFYTPQSNYSKSIRDQFHISFPASGGQVVADFDLCKNNFNAVAAITQAQRQGATTLVILPDGQTCSMSFGNVLNLIKANQGRYSMIGGWGVYDSNILKMRSKDVVERLVVTVPWHRLSSPNPKFSALSEQLWKGEVSGLTATAYDASRVLITALTKKPQPKRSDVREVLSVGGFQAYGATGVISFHFSSGDRNEPISVLVKVVPSKCSPYSHIFVPVNYSKFDSLKCVSKYSTP